MATDNTVSTKPVKGKSKLDPYLDDLGEVDPKLIAEKAGVTVGYVRSYCRRLGIDPDPTVEPTVEPTLEPVPESEPIVEPTVEQAPTSGMTVTPVGDPEGVEVKVIDQGGEVLSPGVKRYTVRQLDGFAYDTAWGILVLPCEVDSTQALMLAHIAWTQVVLEEPHAVSQLPRWILASGMKLCSMGLLVMGTHMVVNAEVVIWFDDALAMVEAGYIVDQATMRRVGGRQRSDAVGGLPLELAPPPAPVSPTPVEPDWKEGDPVGLFEEDDEDEEDLEPQVARLVPAPSPEIDPGEYDLVFADEDEDVLPPEADKILEDDDFDGNLGLEGEEEIEAILAMGLDDEDLGLDDEDLGLDDEDLDFDDEDSDAARLARADEQSLGAMHDDLGLDGSGEDGLVFEDED